MKREGIMKRVVTFAMASVMALSTVVFSGTGQVTKAAALDSASAVNFRTVLGRATDFGLLGTKITQNGHMETTFATKLFDNKADNNDVDMAGSLPVHFIIADATGNGVKFGQAAEKDMILNVETTQTVADGIVIMGNESLKPKVVTTISDKESIENNIDSMIGHIRDESAILASKTSTEGVNITGNGNLTIDLSNESFKDSVVYINVDAGSDLANAAKNSNGIKIVKYSSTVVVFNMPAANKGDTLSINQYTVQVIDKGNEVLTTDHASNAQGHVDEVMIEKDSEICQKIIWNMPYSTKVSLDTTLGCFIVPRSDASVGGGSSGGWLATGGTFDTTAEWHFIYQGRNTNVSTNSSGEMNFASRKAFTHSFTERDNKNEVLEDKTIKTTPNQYKFEFYKVTDNSFSTTGAELIGTVGNDASNTITFPTLTFTEEGDYYYVVKEVDAGKTVDGITNSDGEIDIWMHVTKVTNGGVESFKYQVSTWKYLSAADKAEGKIYKNVDQKTMSGVEWTLGGFYNLADLGNLEVTVLDEDTKTPVMDAKVEITNPDGTKKIYTTDSNGKIEITNTPSGDYKIKVTEVPDGYKVTTGEEEKKTVEDGKTATHVAEITPTGGLKITVLEEDSDEPVKDAVVKVTGPDGTVTEYTTDENGEILVNPTETGDYQIVVTKVPEGKKVTVGETKTVTVEKLKIAEHVAKINKVETTDDTKKDEEKTVTEEKKEDTTPKGNLEITVRDEVTNDPVPNATVNITDPTGDKSDHTTDSAGKVTLTDVPVGDYTVEVTSVPEGYTVTTGQTSTVTVKENETVTETVKVNTPTQTNTPTTTPNTNTTVTSTNQTTDSKKDTTVATGDTSKPYMAMIFMGVSIIGMAILTLLKKKED